MILKTVEIVRKFRKDNKDGEFKWADLEALIEQRDEENKIEWERLKLMSEKSKLENEKLELEIQKLKDNKIVKIDETLWIRPGYIIRLEYKPKYGLQKEIGVPAKKEEAWFVHIRSNKDESEIKRITKETHDNIIKLLDN